jgi:glycosyltransferase involved in cell wall biosynthesis
VNFDLPGWQKKVNYKAISKIDGAIVLGSSLKWIFEGMLPQEKIHTVPNCVDDRYLMSDDDFRLKIENINQKPIKHVLYLSNFIRTKGYAETLKMAKLEKERVEAGGDRKFHFDFAGKFFEETEEQFFNGYIKDNGLENYITYHGIVGGQKKQELLKKCSIFTLLTRYPNEGQPISILEAMGNGMMIVTTDHAGIPDIVRDGLNGIVVDKNKFDIRQCYQTICSKSADDMQAIISRNREETKITFNQMNYIENMRKVFEKV